MSPGVTCSAFEEDASVSPSFSIRILLPHPAAAAASSSPPWKNAPHPPALPPQGRIRGKQHMAPFSLAQAGYFGNEKPPLPFSPLWGAPSLPSPHSPEVLRLRDMSYVQLCDEITAFLP